jgi:hypothetical protein
MASRPFQRMALLAKAPSKEKMSVNQAISLEFIVVWGVWAVNVDKVWVRRRLTTEGEGGWFYQEVITG